jgi:hypothetical protein
MVEKNVKGRQTSSQDSTTQTVVDLLASILGEVQKQVVSKTPTPLTNAAQEAVELFTEIDAALQLLPVPTAITLEAKPNALSEPGRTTLAWTSTHAFEVSINQNIGVVKPVASGSIDVQVQSSTDFTATARSLSRIATATARVTVTVHT